MVESVDAGQPSEHVLQVVGKFIDGLFNSPEGIVRLTLVFAFILMALLITAWCWHQYLKVRQTEESRDAVPLSAFNMMVTEMSQNMQQVNESNRHLYQCVDRLTQELERLNQRLDAFTYPPPEERLGACEPTAAMA